MGNFFEDIGDEVGRWGEDLETAAEEAWKGIWWVYDFSLSFWTFNQWNKLDDYSKEYLRDPLTGRKAADAMMAQQRAQMELQQEQMAQQRVAARRSEERVAAANRRAPDIGMQLASAMATGAAGGNRGTMLAGTKPPMDFAMGGSGSPILGN